jgi:hypothetical protein
MLTGHKIEMMISRHTDQNGIQFQIVVGQKQIRSFDIFQRVKFIFKF